MRVSLLAASCSAQFASLEDANAHFYDVDERVEAMEMSDKQRLLFDMQDMLMADVRHETDPDTSALQSLLQLPDKHRDALSYIDDSGFLNLPVVTDEESVKSAFMQMEGDEVDAQYPNSEAEIDEILNGRQPTGEDMENELIVEEYADGEVPSFISKGEKTSTPEDAIASLLDTMETAIADVTMTTKNKEGKTIKLVCKGGQCTKTLQKLKDGKLEDDGKAEDITDKEATKIIRFRKRDKEPEEEAKTPKSKKDQKDWFDEQESDDKFEVGSKPSGRNQGLELDSDDPELGVFDADEDEKKHEREDSAEQSESASSHPSEYPLI